MKKIIAALALALASSTSSHAATWTFDLKHRFTGAAAGTGSFTFPDQPASSGIVLGAGATNYPRATFTLTLNPLNNPTVVWTTGRLGVNYNIQVPPNANDSIGFIADNGGNIAYGDFSISGSSGSISNGDFSEQNFRSIVANFVRSSVTIGSPNQLFTGANFVEVAAPVPEPGEWAMVAAGLVIVGGVARRRKASHQERMDLA